MVDTRHGAVGRGGPVRRGRGRPPRRVVTDEATTGVQTHETEQVEIPIPPPQMPTSRVGLEEMITAMIRGVLQEASGRQTPEGPQRVVAPEDQVQQPMPTDQAGLEQMVRELLQRTRQVTPETPTQQPMPTDRAGFEQAILEMIQRQRGQRQAPQPVADATKVGIQAERRIDWVKRFSQSNPPLFTGDPTADIELWFRVIDGLFELIEAPPGERQRLAAGQLRDDAFDRWSVYKAERADWTYDEFRSLMLREYSPPGLQTAREVAFYRGSYDETLSVAEVVRQFKKELVYCGHLCQTDTSRIRLLSMRLSPAVLLHASSLGDVPFDRFLEVILRYDTQRLLSAATNQYSHTSRGENRPRDIESSRDMVDRGDHFRGAFRRDTRRAPVVPLQEIRVQSITCQGCYEDGHPTERCPRRQMVCYTCGVRGHRAAYCPQDGGSIDAPAPQLQEPPRPAQLTYPQGQGRGASAGRGRGDGGARGGRGSGRGGRGSTVGLAHLSVEPFRLACEGGQTSGGIDLGLPPPPRIYHMGASRCSDPSTSGIMT